jgi:hypothetical protein
MFAAAALISLLLAACPLPMGPDWQKIVFVPLVDLPFGADAVVGSYNLQVYVPVPTAGALPVQTNTARGDVDVAVVWKDAAGTPLGDSFDQFALGAVYQAEITLTAKNGYGFDPGMRFRYQPEEAVAAQPADNFSTGVRSLSTVTYFPVGAGMTIAGPIDLTALVPSPVMGATPVTSFYAGTYGGTVAWKTGGVETAGLFKAVTAYRAEVSLYPAVGYVFSAGLTVTHSGAEVAASFTRGAGTTAGGLSFPATTTVAAVVVNDLDLTYKVPSPVRGGTPVEYFSTPQYTGWVDWLVGGTTAPHSVFQTNMAYTAKVTLTAASGYTFGNPAVSFTHGSAGTITADNGNGTLTVTAAFAATTDATAVPVNDLDLTYKIPKPVGGGTPAAYFSAPQYTGNVVWTAGGQSLSGLFGANTAYTATVTLTAASGYTFAGVAANAFTYDGVPTISNGAASGAVTIMFPATTNTAVIPVNNLDLSYHVPAPVRGGTPVRYVSDPQYTGNVAWSVSAGGHALGGLFEAGTAYTATVTLTAASGYTFTGVGANAFTHESTNALNSVGSGVVSIAFPATEPNQTTVINSVDLTNLLPAPITGATPRMDFPGVNYSGIAAWTTAGGFPVTIFEVGTVYTAVVTLYPAPGYSFPAAVPVTHGGIAIANFTGEPRQGTVTFPATGILALYNGPFSGSSSVDDDSAIDVIRMARDADHPILYLQLSPRSLEQVTPDGSTDIGAVPKGLVLDKTNSPPKVSIDGGKRTIELTTNTSSLITVGEGVTLTLRNITLIGFNSPPIVNTENGGQVIYETGVSIIENAAFPFSGFTTKTDDSAIDKIRAAKTANTPSISIPLSPGIEGVNLNGTSDLGTGLVLDSTNSPASVTINGNGRTVQMDAGSASGSIITVGSGVTLTLRDITFKGSSGNTSPLITVNAGGKLILDTGAVITDNKGNGVYISGSNSAVEMNNGARIENNGQSGVFAEDGGRFTMSGGTVSGNTAERGGGVSIIEGSFFTMSGGTIRNNTAESSGGGVYILKSTFSKTGGTIYGSNDALFANASYDGSHAVFFKYSLTVRSRANTAGETANMDGALDGAAGGWDIH